MNGSNEIFFGEKLYVILPLCSLDSIAWVVTLELVLSLYEKPVEKFSKSQKSTRDSGLFLSFLTLFKLIDLDSILSSVNLLYSSCCFLVSNDLIDADKGISLSKGSYFGVIIEVDDDTYKGSFIPHFDGRSLSIFRLAEASYWIFSSLDLSEILCWIDPNPTEVYLKDDETVPISDNFKFKFAFAAQPFVLSKSVSLSSLNHKHADLDALSLDNGFFTPIIKFRIDPIDGLPLILIIYFPFNDVFEKGVLKSIFSLFLWDFNESNSSIERFISFSSGQIILDKFELFWSINDGLVTFNGSSTS